MLVRPASPPPGPPPGVGRAAGLAHILLPSSEVAADVDHPGKYADTAIPSLLADLERLMAARVRGRLSAKLVGGADMFASSQAEGIGERNRQAVEQILAELRIPVGARDLGGRSGRRVTLDPATGRVVVKIPGGSEYEI